MKIHALAAAFTLGTLWAVMLCLWTLVAAYNGYGSDMLELVEGIYPLYNISYLGALWGLLFGFIDGFIGTYVLVLVYNFFVKKLEKK